MGLLLATGTYAQETVPSPGGVAEIERVIVTGSNIPTAQEVGAKSGGHVSSGRHRKTGASAILRTCSSTCRRRWAPPATRMLSAAAMAASYRNLRGLLPKETLVLIDGKRVAIAASGGAPPVSGIGPAGVDINLIPFPMIDHIDILKDGASAVYGSDAVAGVINIFLLHKFRGLEIGGSYWEHEPGCVQ